MNNKIQGFGGGGKGDGGGGNVASDSLRSIQYAVFIDALSEGPIKGLANGLQSVYFDGVPLQNRDGTFNFVGKYVNGQNNISTNTTSGTNTLYNAYSNGDLNGQAVSSAISAIPGLSAAEFENQVGVKIKNSTSHVERIVQDNVDHVRVTLSFDNGIYVADSSGNINGTSVAISIDIQNNGAGYVEKVTDIITGKASSRYQRSYIIALNGSGPFDIRVRRLTADSTSTLMNDGLTWSTYTGIVSTNLSYQHTAWQAFRVDASQFSGIPSRAYDTYGLIIKVPANYDPVSRTYSGSWDGTFKLAWSNNPAWVFYDLVTNSRYGLGSFVNASLVDKWQLYQIARYCDETVYDGEGGTEPRFVCNYYLQNQGDAYKVLQDLCSVFRSVTYWGAGTLSVSQDAPSSPIALFTVANVIGGTFSYAGSSLKTRHTVALVEWYDPSDQCRPKVEYVQDDDSVRKYGVMQTNVKSFGCTSRGQAHRFGKSILFTEKFETETVTFKCGLDGAYLYPGAIIQTSDPMRAGKRMGGRLVSGGINSLTLDSVFTPDSGASNFVISVIGSDGSVVSSGFTTSDGLNLHLTTPLSVAPLSNAIYIISESNIEPETWRIVAIEEGGMPNEIAVTAVSYNDSKYGFIENGQELDISPTSNIKSTPDKVKNISVITTGYFSSGGVSVLLSWNSSFLATSYVVTWSQSSGLPKTQVSTEQSIEIEGLNPGVFYSFSIMAVSSIGINSQSETTNRVINYPIVPDVTTLSISIKSDGVYAYFNQFTRLFCELRIGDGWVKYRNSLISGGNFSNIGWQKAGNVKVFARYVDEYDRYSTNIKESNIEITAPSAPLDVSIEISGASYQLSWSKNDSMQPIDYYQVLFSESNRLSDAILITNSKTTQISNHASKSGTFYVAAVDLAGNTGDFASAQLILKPPSKPALTCRVIDNNINLYWSDVTQTLPIVYYSIRQGTSFDTAVDIGTKQGLFTVIYEDIAGEYIIWVAGVDSAGNIGEPASIRAVASNPGGYVLHTDYFSDFSNGKLMNAALRNGSVIFSVNQSLTWSQHFDSNGWLKPIDQVSAGFPIYIEPTLGSSSYIETYDYGSVISSTIISVIPTMRIIDGNPSYSVNIWTSDDNVNWSKFNGVESALSVNFRYVQIQVIVDSPNRNSLIEMSSLEMKISQQSVQDSGSLNANASDTNGTEVYFNIPFIGVDSITLTAQTGIGVPVTCEYEISEEPHPSSFNVFVLNAKTGERVSGKISWQAKGF